MKEMSDPKKVKKELPEPLYRVGDYVRIVREPWNQHAGEIVRIEKISRLGEGWHYNFVIPERSGGAVEKFIERVVIPAKE
jgi:hypothetical protein